MNPESVGKHSNRNIVVTTKEGNKIKFESGEYQIVTDTLGSQILKGKGKTIDEAGLFFKPFEGSLSLSEIETISACCESTPWLYVTIIGVSFTVGYIAVMAILFQGRGFGG